MGTETRIVVTVEGFRNKQIADRFLRIVNEIGLHVAADLELGVGARKTEASGLRALGQNGVLAGLLNLLFRFGLLVFQLIEAIAHFLDFLAKLADFIGVLSGCDAMGDAHAKRDQCDHGRTCSKTHFYLRLDVSKEAEAKSAHTPSVVGGSRPQRSPGARLCGRSHVRTCEY